MTIEELDKKLRDFLGNADEDVPVILEWITAYGDARYEQGCDDIYWDN